MAQTKEAFDASMDEDLVLEHLGYQQGMTHTEASSDWGRSLIRVQSSNDRSAYLI